MPLAANREKRKTEREARQLVWRKLFEARAANPNADHNELAAIVAADLQDEGELLGFDIGILLQLLVTLLPLIMKLFNK